MSRQNLKGNDIIAQAQSGTGKTGTFSISALSIVDKLSSRFKLIFKDIEDGERCNRPYINKRKLYDKLKRAFQQHDIDEDSLYKQILEYNEFNRKTKLDIIDLSTASINKCKQSGCYL